MIPALIVLLQLGSALCKGTSAIATIQGQSGKGATIGYVSFRQEGGLLSIKGRVDGLQVSNTTQHGFHIHEFGDLTQGCMSQGGHYNPFGAQHGAPNDTWQNRHVGDFGNIEVFPNGTAIIDTTDYLATLDGLWSIVGRGVVIHLLRDDLGRGGNPESKKTGNAGARIACGVIGSLNEAWH